MKRTRGLACLIWLCSSTAFADDIVNIALVRPGPALIQNPCRAQTQYPLASLSTVLYVNRRLASSLPGGHEPIVMMEGSGLTDHAVSRFLIEQKTTGVRNVSAITDLFAPDGYLFTRNEGNLPAQTQRDWIAAAFDRNTPLLGSDAACALRSARGDVCKNVSRTFVIGRGNVKVGVISTANDDAGSERAIYFRDSLRDVDAVVWIRHAVEDASPIPAEHYGRFDAIVSPLHESDRHPKVVPFATDRANMATVSLRFRNGDVTILDQQLYDADDFEPLPETTELLGEIETAFCASWDKPERVPDLPSDVVWRNALRSFTGSELVSLPTDDRPFATTRLRHDESTTAVSLFTGEVPGKTLRLTTRILHREPVDTRAFYSIVGSRAELQKAGAVSIRPVVDQTGHPVGARDVVWKNRDRRADSRRTSLLFTAGPTIASTHTVVPDDLNPYAHRVFDGPLTSFEPGVELAAHYFDGKRDRDFRVEALLQFGALDVGAEDEPFVIPTRDRIALDATLDYTGWRDVGPRYLLPLPRLRLGLESQFSRNRDIPGHRVEPYLELGPAWQIGPFFEIGLSLGPRAYVRGTAEFGFAYGAFYTLRPLALFYIVNQPFQVTSSGSYGRVEFGDDFAVNIRHRHEVSQRFFDFIDLYGALDAFHFGRGSVAEFASHRQWIAGVRATFFLRRHTIETTYE